MSALNSTIATPVVDLPVFVPSAKNVSIIIILTIIVIITMLGNLIVLLAFVLEPKLRIEAFNYFILNLAITDFLVAVTAMTFYTIDTVLGYWPFGPAMCGFWIYADYAMTFASVFTLTAISIDRFWSVTWPIYYRMHATVRKTAIMICIVWGCVFIIWTPPFIGDRLKHNEEYSCIWEPNENREFIIVVDVIGHYLPCLIMVISYLKVFSVMRRRAKIGPRLNFNTESASSSLPLHATNSFSNGNKNHTKGHSNQLQTPSTTNPSTSKGNLQVSESDISVNTNACFSASQRISTKNTGTFFKRIITKNVTNKDDTRYNKIEKKIFTTLSYVLLCYLVCWFPFYVTWDIYAFHSELVPPMLYTIMFWMTYINSTLNPLIYAYTNKYFRKAFLRIIRCNR